MTTKIITLERLERFEDAGLLRGPALGGLRSELQRRRDERDRLEQLVAEAATAETLLAELERQKTIERVTWAADGTDRDAVIISIRTSAETVLATEEVDGRTVNYHAAGVLTFVPAGDWKRLEQQIRASLERIHAYDRGQAGGVDGAIVVRPGEARDDLIALVAESTRPLGMARDQQIKIIAGGVQLGQTAQRWLGSARASVDPAGRAVVRILGARFSAANQPSAPAE